MKIQQITCILVVTPLGTRLCRPSEIVLDILADSWHKSASLLAAGEQRVGPISARS